MDDTEETSRRRESVLLPAQRYVTLLKTSQKTGLFALKRFLVEFCCFFFIVSSTMELFFCEYVQQRQRRGRLVFAFQMFYVEGNAFNTFVRAQEYTQSILVSDTECKHNFCLFKTPQGTFKMVLMALFFMAEKP